MNNLSTKVESLDQDWVDLILAALEMGMSVQEIREFLHEGKS